METAIIYGMSKILGHEAISLNGPLKQMNMKLKIIEVKQ